MIRLLICFLFSLPLIGVAQTDDFTVRLFTGVDTTSPTTPILTSVTPISSNQIDVVWGPVTDNVLVSGYRVFRDGIQIATTTQTQFSDTGLTASTTYEYTVDAFDILFNISSTSNARSTTTLPIFVPPTPTSTATSSRPVTSTQTLQIPSLLITSTEQSAVVVFTTTLPSVYSLRFGRTTSYELGTVSNSIFKTEHSSTITSLEPGTRYYVELVVVGPRGQREVVTDTFETKPALTTDSPLSVSNASLEVLENTVTIRWENPDLFVGQVRVVRNYLFYPQHIADGVVVYEGRGESIIDKDILRERSPYYYTIFVVAPDGRVSAGVVLVASSQNVPVSDNSVLETPVLPVVPGVSDPYEEGQSTLDPSDIFFTFESETRSLVNLDVIPVGTPILVSIPRSALPPSLKSVLVTIENPVNNNEVTVYLLKLSADETRYEARFVSSNVEGEGRITVGVYNFETALIHRIIKRVMYDSSPQTMYDVATTALTSSFLIVFSVISFFLLVLLLLLLKRRP